MNKMLNKRFFKTDEQSYKAPCIGRLNLGGFGKATKVKGFQFQPKLNANFALNQPTLEAYQKYCYGALQKIQPNALSDEQQFAALHSFYFQISDYQSDINSKYELRDSAGDFIASLLTDNSGYEWATDYVIDPNGGFESYTAQDSSRKFKKHPTPKRQFVTMDWVVRNYQNAENFEVKLQEKSKNPNGWKHSISINMYAPQITQNGYLEFRTAATKSSIPAIVATLTNYELECKAIEQQTGVAPLANEFFWLLTYKIHKSDISVIGGGFKSSYPVFGLTYYYAHQQRLQQPNTFLAAIAGVDSPLLLNNPNS